jgi:hypothetical protein
MKVLFVYVKFFSIQICKCINHFERGNKKNSEGGRCTKHHTHPLLKIRFQRCLTLFIEVCNILALQDINVIIV